MRVCPTDNRDDPVKENMIKGILPLLKNMHKMWDEEKKIKIFEESEDMYVKVQLFLRALSDIMNDKPALHINTTIAISIYYSTMTLHVQ